MPNTAQQHQAAYWDSVAEHIADSNSPNQDMVGYHSPYDLHVRKQAAWLLERMAQTVPTKDCIAELGSGAGLNLRYFSQFKPQNMLAFDCSARLLELARKNLRDLSNVTYIQTSGSNLPVPAGTQIDLLYTLTVLQHITNPDMFHSVASSMKASGAQHILVIEDTHAAPRQPTADYTLRSADEYIHSFLGGEYMLVQRSFVSLSWARVVFGTINRLCGLYRRKEGAHLSKAVFALTSYLSPPVRLLDALLPGKFGMTAMLFERKP